jgi:small nuclear ribonucleoprotein (snRNP)-like protein
MAFPRRHHFKKRHGEGHGELHGERHGVRHGVRHGERHGERPPRFPEAHELMQPEHTGSESTYMKSLIDTHAKVTVVLTSGERLQGHIRYYDRDCFSIGTVNNGPKLFLRKDSVCYIAEDQDQ